MDDLLNTDPSTLDKKTVIVVRGTMKDQIAFKNKIEDNFKEYQSQIIYMAELMKEQKVKIDDKKKLHVEEKARADKLQAEIDAMENGNKIQDLEYQLEDLEKNEKKF